MLKFPTQYGVEIYPSITGHICLTQQSIEFGKEVTVVLTIGQLRGLVKNANALIKKAEEFKESSHEANS